jgi:hypothetical protein
VGDYERAIAWEKRGVEDIVSDRFCYGKKRRLVGYLWVRVSACLVNLIPEPFLT